MWAWRPVWVVALSVALAPLVAAFACVELRRINAPSPSSIRAGAAAMLVTAGIAILSRKGFVHAGMPMGLPVMGVGLVAGGWALLHRA